MGRKNKTDEKGTMRFYINKKSLLERMPRGHFMHDTKVWRHTDHGLAVGNEFPAFVTDLSEYTEVGTLGDFLKSN